LFRFSFFNSIIPLLSTRVNGIKIKCNIKFIWRNQGDRNKTIACYTSRTGRALSIIATLAHIKVNLCRELTAATAEAYPPSLSDGLVRSLSLFKAFTHLERIIIIVTVYCTLKVRHRRLRRPFCLCHFLWAKHLALHKANGHKTAQGTGNREHGQKENGQLKGATQN